MFAYYGGMIDFEGKLLSPNEMDPLNINLDESLRHSIRALSCARALEEVLATTKDVYGEIPESEKKALNLENYVKEVIINTDLFINLFISKYISAARSSE